jgi:NAD(P)-dependent dehydrogenase (short-subunit alcohol dehydrogenase family)
MTAPQPGLDGQVAIVTGGGKGIGRAIALELAASGVRVLVTGRDEKALGEAVGEIVHGGGRGRHLVGDVRDERHAGEAVARAVETWGGLDIVVANAGISGTTRIGDATALPLARAILETNLLGTYFVFHAALAAMKGPGRLLAISSVLGKFGVAEQSAYCASKAGLHGLVRSLAIDTGPRSITCNAVCPGWVDTEMARGRMEALATLEGRSTEEAWRRALEDVPLGRAVDAAEVARLVAFLCAPAAAAITGQAISICGGTTTFAG